MTPQTRAARLATIVLLAAAALGPLAWRAAGSRRAAPDAVASYLPSVEVARPRVPFNDNPRVDLRDLQPGIVVIGDSMAGRVNEFLLDARLDVRVAPIRRNASGSGYWYLAFKNYVIASGSRPALTLVFFRDTNLTDLTFRLLDDYRVMLDEVAGAEEPELDAVIARKRAGAWHRVHTLIERVSGVDEARARFEPALTAWPARVIAGSRGGPRLQAATNAHFALDRLRPMPLSDMSVVSENDADFDANVDVSVLPLFLSLAHEHALRLVFVRTQRRTADGRPRVDTPALAQYMADLRQYIEARGGALIDDQADPEIAALPYDDFDHLARGAHDAYTEMLAQRLRPLLR